MRAKIVKKVVDASDTNDLAKLPRHVDSNHVNETNQAKLLSTQIAQFALAGHSVIKHRDCSFTVHKYGYSYFAIDFENLKEYAIKLGVNS